MSTALWFCWLSVCSFLSGVADATPFTIQPDGDLVIRTTYQTREVFSCSGFFLSVPCSGSGMNTITLGSGAHTMSVTFFDASASVSSVAQTPVTVPLGTFVATATHNSWTEFLFDPGNTGQIPLVRFDLSLLQSSPNDAVVLKQFFFGRGSRDAGLTRGRPEEFQHHISGRRLSPRPCSSSAPRRPG